MDTRDQALTKLTRLHDESHPTPHRPASLWRNYSLPVGSIMELAMQKDWWWRRSKIPLSGAPNGLQIWPPDEERRWRRLCLVERDNSFSLIFFGKIGFYSVGLRVCGATRWGQPTWAHMEGGDLVGCAHLGAPLRWFLAPEILFYCIKIPPKVSFHSQNFYFCTKTTPW